MIGGMGPVTKVEKVRANCFPVRVEEDHGGPPLPWLPADEWVLAVLTKPLKIRERPIGSRHLAFVLPDSGPHFCGKRGPQRPRSAQSLTRVGVLRLQRPSDVVRQGVCVLEDVAPVFRLEPGIRVAQPAAMN
jgi:hypothetical protein